MSEKRLGDDNRKGPPNMDAVAKSKTEMIHGGGTAFRAGVSAIINPRFIDNAWLSSFKVLRYLKREIFSD